LCEGLAFLKNPRQQSRHDAHTTLGKYRRGKTMDWTTIKVLTENLEVLLQEMKDGAHLCKDDFGMTGVKNSWNLSVLALSKSLKKELGCNDDDSQIAQSWKHFSSQNLEKNPYVRNAIDITTLAEKLLSDYEKLEKQPNQSTHSITGSAGLE
jgi:hypothetical protein